MTNILLKLGSWRSGSSGNVPPLQKKTGITQLTIYKEYSFWAVGVSQVVEHLPSKHEDPVSPKKERIFSLCLVLNVSCFNIKL
jgi:hypothetical protein